MGAAVVRGHNLDVLVPTPAIPILVLDAGIGKVHVTVLVRQLVLPRPSRDLLRFAIGPPVAVVPLIARAPKKVRTRWMFDRSGT